MAHRTLFILAGALTLLPPVSSWMALLFGIFFALTFGNPFEIQTKKWTTPLLQLSVIGLGAAMNLSMVIQTGIQGFGYTVVGILLTFAAGLGLGKIMKIDREISLLLTAGTAICGGSAIAAVASTIRAKSSSTSVSLAAVFSLNALALVIFPPIGHFLNLDQHQFGILSALAVHDTSSVVGAALQYGSQALEVATPIKLARALWIVPMTLMIGHFWVNSDAKTAGSKTKKPWFILGFILVAALVTWIPELKEAGEYVAMAAKRTLVLTLFLIGSGLSKSALTQIGFRPLAQGIALWFAVCCGTLGALKLGWLF